MKKIIVSVIFVFLFIVFVSQVAKVLAGHGDKPVTSPVTSPITGSTFCKFGWGWGDKNHCHIGPKGHEENHDKDDKHDNDNHEDHHDNGKHNGDDHKPFLSPLGHR